MTVHIREHRPGSDISDFIRASHEVFRGDSKWVPPLEMEIRERLDPARNPFFGHAEATLFTAWRNGRPVGRCTAQIDHEHLRIHNDQTGFFGFFDTLEDPEVAQGLVRAAEQWLDRRGMQRMRGPLSLSINEEVGMLVDGFEHPPFILMNHARPYQATMAAAAGLEKAKDLFAWRYQAGQLPSRATKAWDAMRAMPEVKLRSVDTKNMLSELRLIMDVFNDAWSDNWGFVPATEAEVIKTARDLKLILDERLTFIAEIDGRAVGICVCLPNLNEAIHDLGGKLLPLGLPKLLWRVKVKHPSSARLMMLGIRKELRGIKKYGPLSTAMYVELVKRGVPIGYDWGELSWTLEDNHAVNLGIRAMGGKVYKTYRLFEKPIGTTTSPSASVDTSSITTATAS